MIFVGAFILFLFWVIGGFVFNDLKRAILNFFITLLVLFLLDCVEFTIYRMIMGDSIFYFLF